MQKRMTPQERAIEWRRRWMAHELATFKPKTGFPDSSHLRRDRLVRVMLQVSTSRRWKDNWFPLSADYVANRTTMSRSTCARALTELESAGLIEVSRTGVGSHRANRVRLVFRASPGRYAQRRAA